jgi:hypothetical protein
MSNSWVVACESGEWFPVLADYSPIPPTERNACLMANAPDMLALLERAEWLLRDMPRLSKDETALLADISAMRAAMDGGRQ